MRDLLFAVLIKKAKRHQVRLHWPIMKPRGASPTQERGYMRALKIVNRNVFGLKFDLKNPCKNLILFSLGVKVPRGKIHETAEDSMTVNGEVMTKEKVLATLVEYGKCVFCQHEGPVFNGACDRCCETLEAMNEK